MVVVGVEGVDGGLFVVRGRLGGVCAALDGGGARLLRGLAARLGAPCFALGGGFVEMLAVDFRGFVGGLLLRVLRCVKNEMYGFVFFANSSQVKGVPCDR